MPIKRQITIQNTLTAPKSEFSVSAQGRSFPTQSFNNEEASLFEQQLNELVVPNDESKVTDLFVQRANAIALGATFAKQHFDGKLFGGLNPGDNEIGFDVLRPGQIRADPADGGVANTWDFDPPGAGWNDWIGDGAANNRTLDDNQVTVIMGMLDQADDSAVSGINVNTFGRNVDMVPKDLNVLKIADNSPEQHYAPLPTLIAQENDDVHIRLRHDADLASQPRLLGFTFGLGTYLNTEDY